MLSKRHLRSQCRIGIYSGVEFHLPICGLNMEVCRRESTRITRARDWPRRRVSILLIWLLCMFSLSSFIVFIFHSSYHALTHSQAMVQPHGSTHPSSQYFPASSSFQQGNSKSVYFPGYSVRIGNGDFLALYSAVAKCAGHEPGSGGTFLFARGVWSGYFAAG